MDTDYNHMVSGGGANTTQALLVPYFLAEGKTEPEMDADLRVFNEEVASMLPVGCFIIRLDTHFPKQKPEELPHILQITMNFNYRSRRFYHAEERFAVGEWVRGLFSGFLMRHGHRVLFTP